MQPKKYFVIDFDFFQDIYEMGDFLEQKQYNNGIKYL